MSERAIASEKFRTLELEEHKKFWVVRLSRPAKLNAINEEMLDELLRVVELVKGERSIRSLIITGAGQAFCSGADLTWFRDIREIADFLSFSEKIQRTINAIADLDRPSIAAINGLALGGGLELALACDFRIATRSAKLGLPEVKIGILPGAGGTQRLTRMVPLSVATRMLLTGDSISAEAALQCGLLNEVVEDGQAAVAAADLAGTLSGLAPLAVHYIKQLIQISLTADIRTGMRAEHQAAASLFSSQDLREGISAFLEKRQPRFHGR